MDARALSDEQLERVIQDARQFLAEGEPDDPDQVRRVLAQAEDEQGRRQRLVWGEDDITFWGEGL